MKQTTYDLLIKVILIISALIAVYKVLTLVSLVKGKKCKQWVTRDLLFGGTKNVACMEWE